MKDNVSIRSALVSVFYKDGLEPLIHQLGKKGVAFYSTGGTRDFITGLGYEVHKVEDITNYPPILDGRVKTLHPKIFGGILAVRKPGHLQQLEKYEIPALDLVIVDLYPFEETLARTTNHEEIIEKIDIGGISLIRAAAKNYQDVVVISSKEDYSRVLNWLETQEGTISLEQRKWLAAKAFAVSSRYDALIGQYMAGDIKEAPSAFIRHVSPVRSVRYGENPHQSATFYGKLEDQFEILGGKELSYNNLVDVDAAVQLMREFVGQPPTFAILKHTNVCGIATRSTIQDAYIDALACDPLSAFGGIFIANTAIDSETAHEINKLFYEVIIAPGFDGKALDILTANSKRIVLIIKHFNQQNPSFKSILTGVLVQEPDLAIEDLHQAKVVTIKEPSEQELADMRFALVCAKHLKSNTIALVKNQQLIGMGCGQTSRVDACKQAIEKASQFGFDLKGAVMASDAFFPFPDCVEIAHEAGIASVVQPGGSIKDQLSIDFCDKAGMSMVVTGVRHFKH